MSRRIIGFAGRKRSGKDMFAKAIKKCDPNTEIIAIADNLKILCAELLNVTLQRLNQMKDDGTTFSVKMDGRWTSLIKYHTGIDDKDICETIGDVVFTNVRQMLQIIGTNLIRKYCPEWHIDKTIERIHNIDEGKTVVIDDIRFPNERCKITAIGGEVYFVMRPNNFDVSNHESETAILYSEFEQNMVIINDLPKDKMEAEIEKVFIKGEESDILLSKNPWYIEHMIDNETYETNFNADRRTIIKLVIERNKNLPQFTNNGIITFKADDAHALHLFRRIIMNDRRSTDGATSYSIYNPITNEVLKLFM